MQNYKKITFTILQFSFLLFCSCSGESSNIKSNNLPTEDTHLLKIDKTESAYPAPSYPQNDYETIARPTANPGPKFHIDKPVKSNSSLVTGSGPSDIPIILVDVSDFGEELAKTVIDNDGIFGFELKTPLISSHTIGIKLGDLSRTNFNPDDFIYSDSYYDRPMIGILFDIAIVEE